VPDEVTRATREYLDTLDDAAFGAATPVKPKSLSPSDPAARLTAATGDRAFFAYSTNDLVDLDGCVSIVDVAVTSWYLYMGQVTRQALHLARRP